MLTELKRALARMVLPGEELVCAVSGGADSMALLWGAYLLKDSLGYRLSAAHFDHGLRGAESHRDAQFVREFCQSYGIPLWEASGQVTAGKKGLEAAAREARYGFFDTLPGKIATAHTADDNGETVLMHLIRGTGLKGLGGIAPESGRLIRPMLNITRAQVEAFLAEYHIDHVEDSSNETDAFLRNRLRHHVMPLLKRENPRLAENLSAMAQRLRQEETVLAEAARFESLPEVEELRVLAPAIRSRMMEAFLKQNGVLEPEAQHIALAEKLIFSPKPSAQARFPGGVTLRRNYSRLEVIREELPLETVILPENGTVVTRGWRITLRDAEELLDRPDCFTVVTSGPVVLRCRREGDEFHGPGGTKSLKKLFIDKKIPAKSRLSVPVISDDTGIIGVYGLGTDRARLAKTLPARQIILEREREIRHG